MDRTLVKSTMSMYGDAMREEDIVIRHLNGERSDNRPVNIVLATRSEVMMASADVWRLAYGANAAQRRRALSDGQALELRTLRSNGASLKQLCERFGIAKSTASYIVNGRTYA